ncbi:MAG TPA: energy transducer TonB [Gemmatimonas sp.]|uniref:energy transducer TonB n=1 Tax=Gemmatimonas sp. TaxID=1962908 RepID=UPI002ED83AC9
MHKRRVRLTLFESTRRVMPWLLVQWQLMGMGSMATAVGAVAAFSTVPIQLPPPAADALVRFIAPPKQSAPAPSTERLSFIGLGVPSEQSSGDFQVPEPDGTVPVAAKQGGDNGFDETPTPEVVSERLLTEIDVDSAAALDPTAVGPDYPVKMLEKNIEGLVLAQFVVDSLGHADIATFKLLEPADPEFVVAVKAALPRMKYRPASLNGRPVPQLVQQPFGFRIRPPGAG